MNKQLNILILEAEKATDQLFEQPWAVLTDREISRVKDKLGDFSALLMGLADPIKMWNFTERFKINALFVRIS